MLYHKFKTGGTTIINELNDDEIITFCGGCRKEMDVTLEDIAHIHEKGADFCGTTYYCKECAKRYMD
jgi:beta-glucosidase/6-phospho-beta-glucosidase/beta-galactosidase